MRTEKEMYDLIINTAAEDERIRAVYMNGSRTNPNAPKDIFQDYDIVYVVPETEPFIRDKAWIDRFGERLFMQYPEDSSFWEADTSRCYGWLIQFCDGNRLDLHVMTVEAAQTEILSDRLCRILLDKDGILPEMPEATDEDFWVKRPTDEEYVCTCNEFWWCLDNVAKGLWRNEMTYVLDMLNSYVRTQLEQMLAWKVGTMTEFRVSVGKAGKYMHRWLPEQEWQEFLDTYCGADPEECWNAVMKMCQLFEKTAVYVGEQLGYTYNMTEGRNCCSYLEHVRRLPKDAKEVYP